MLGGGCCRCEQELRGHKYQVFAITVATIARREILHDFFPAAMIHDWESLSKYQDFEGGKNAAEICAMSCPTGDLTALYMRDPVELFDSTGLEDWDPLDENDAQKWESFLPQSKWVSFDEKVGE
jgi:hypothetical protein